jgi:tight adherence protein C
VTLLLLWTVLAAWSAVRFRPTPPRMSDPTATDRRLPRARPVNVIRRRRRERARMLALTRDLPDAVDLLTLAASAGLTVALAVETVGERSDGPVAEAFRWAGGRERLGLPLADALEAVPAEFGEPLRPLVRPLIATQRYGLPLRPALDTLAGEVRMQRRHTAERAARKLPVKLLFPLVLCILPAFALLTVVPVIASSLRDIEF